MGLSSDEALALAQTFGPRVICFEEGKYYIRRNPDGACPFLLELGGRGLCGLQGGLKPRACKLWPARVRTYPKHGSPSRAEYWHEDLRLFVYFDSSCLGLELGKPTERFELAVVPEFVRLALELQREQVFSTSQLEPPVFSLQTRMEIDEEDWIHRAPAPRREVPPMAI